jgi:hypothetical protein
MSGRLRRPERHQYWKRGEGTVDAQPEPGGGGHTEASQQKSKEGDATPDLFLKHPDTTLTTYV